jgi:phage tail tape-measure protein
MGPDWLGSPQHLVGGFALALAAGLLTRAWVDSWWRLVILAVGITAIAEIAFEIIEYPLLYEDSAHATAYWDTVADLAASLVGALLGAAVAVAIDIRADS